ncbi:MAG: L,D-transpeptidase family protein [Gammaproteobacteria bacterium]|nr:L,D-transpeptidase family protein [Gammaproteobacteria bacterium]MBU1415294.1 L,D-transpeptidase family protein [Gammaproteobacteria bacterium]
MLARVFDLVEHGHWEQALEQTDALIRGYPNFRLAHLIRGDLLLAHARPLTAFGEGGVRKAGSKVDDLREEALVRLHAYRDRPKVEYVPRYLLQLRTDQKYAVVVDTKKSRLYLYRNADGTPHFVADYYVSQGKQGDEKTREGDQRTPIGVYHVTASLPRQKLTDFYGTGAFPISYPNDWDRRMGRNGHGIWLHGTPSDTFSRPPKSSDGCVVLANPDLDALGHRLQVGLTPVIISNSIEWLSLDDWQAERKALLTVIDEWRQDWESRDVDRYARHYSRKFKSDRYDYTAWVDHKRNVNAGKTWIKVTTGNISMFRNPGKEEHVVVTFEQDYRSSNVNNTMKKRQYWIKEDGRWKIVHEGAA